MVSCAVWGCAVPLRHVELSALPQTTMTETRYAVILVYSTSHALRAERILQGVDIVCKLIPVPRQISSDCGICVRVQESDAEQAMAALKAARVGTEGMYTI